ncbi:MAG: hypothetical protein HHJ09_04420 [Glaciimonas sp.]|nr:hypothetical protein [Glaciimonas sp.]
MSNNQIRFCSALTNTQRKAVWLSALMLLVLNTAFAATAAMAASNTSDADARYQADRAICNSGQSNQDRATCLKEAGAARQESKKGQLDSGKGTYQQNALIRCNALPADERDACQRRIEGEGTTSGSVRSGGLLRELVVPDNK